MLIINNKMLDIKNSINKRKIKGIIFDCDGTLINIDKYLYRFIELQKTVHADLMGSIPNKWQEFYEPFRLTLLKAEEWIRENGMDPKEYWSMLHSLDLKERIAAVDSGMLYPYSDIEELKRFKEAKYKLGLLSNTPEDIVLYVVRYFGLVDSFDSIVCAFYKDNMAKPEQGGFRKCLSEIGLKEDEVILVGDGPMDLEIMANVKTVLIMRGHKQPVSKKSPSYIVRSLYELGALVNDLNEEPLR